MHTYIVMLRGIGANTHKLMSMADWRAAAEAGGFTDVSTVLATGNMVLNSPLSAGEVAQSIDSITESFGLGVKQQAFVVSPDVLAKQLADNPFPDAATERPGKLLYYYVSASPDTGWINEYDGPERLALLGNLVVVDYVDGVGESRVANAGLERRCGVSMTGRNWNTLHKLHQKAMEIIGG